MKALLIKQVRIGEVEGTPLVHEELSWVQPKDGREFSLKELYELLECELVEHLDLVKGVHLWVDEEGRLKDKPLVNVVATRYFNKAFPKDKYEYPGGVTDIVGNALIIDNTKNGWL